MSVKLRIVGIACWMLAVGWLPPSSCAHAKAPGAAQQTLVVAAYPPTDEIIKAAIPQWRLQHPNVNIRVLTREVNDHHSVMAASLATASNLPDVMLVEASYLGRLASFGTLENLDLMPFNAGRLKQQWVPFAFEQGRTPSGEQVAVPTDIGPGTLLYRTDLLDQAGVSVEDLTRSWESFVAAGVKIKAATGVALVSDAGGFGLAVINTTAVPGESRFFDAHGGISVELPRFVKAFELAREVYKNQLELNAAQWTPTWSDAMAKGRVATMLTGTWMATHMANWLAPQFKGKWRAAPLPQASQGAWGGSFYAIPKRSQDKVMAWQLVQFMTLTPQIQLAAFKSHNAFPALLEVQDDPFFYKPIDYLGGQTARLLWRQASREIRGTLLHPFDEVARDVVQSELNKVLREGKEIPQALHDARVILERYVSRAALSR